jgi:hypothetical protein
LKNSVLAREYQLSLPDESKLTESIAEERRAFQARIAPSKGRR